jgi:ABC-2 type transport system permease protein
MEEPMNFMTTINSGLVYLPAIWMMIAISAFLIAYLPKLTSLVWGLIGFSFFVVYLGKLLNFPNWFHNAVIYGAIPTIPVVDMNWIPLIILSILTIIIMIISVIGYRKRDLVMQ